MLRAALSTDSRTGTSRFQSDDVCDVEWLAILEHLAGPEPSEVESGRTRGARIHDPIRAPRTLRLPSQQFT